MGLTTHMTNMNDQIDQLTKHRDGLIAKANSTGNWDAGLYSQIEETGKRLSELDKLPDPDTPELDLRIEAKPKKGW